jgi:hypothetical protein
MVITPLSSIAYNICMDELYKSNIDIIPLFLWYNYIHNFNKFYIILYKFLLYLNKNNKLDLFENIYYSLIKYCNKNDIKFYLLESYNTINLNHHFFEKILLFDLVKTNIIYREPDDIKLFFDTKKHKMIYKYKENESIINSDFQKNFDIYTNNLFVDFNWDNCIVAGGVINKIICKKFMEKLKYGYYNNSDIDIFLYGTTDIKKDKILYIISFLKNKLGEYYLIRNANVLTLVFPNYHCEIQIIIGYYITPFQVINDFDLSHLQMCYNGKNIKGTINTINTLESRISKVMKNKITYKLAEKTFISGFSMAHMKINDPYYSIFFRNNEKNIQPLLEFNEDNFINKTNLFFEKIKNKISSNKEFNITQYSKLKYINRHNCYYIDPEIDIDLTYINKLNLNFNGCFLYNSLIYSS